MRAPMFFSKIDEFLTTLIEKDVVRQVLVTMCQYLLLEYDTAHGLSRLWRVVATTSAGLQPQKRHSHVYCYGGGVEGLSMTNGPRNGT